MNTIRRSLVIGLVVVCGCGSSKITAPPTEQIQREQTAGPIEAVAPIIDEPADAEAAIEASRPKIELLIPTKEFDTAPKTRALLVKFEDLNLRKVLNMDHVTEDVVSLMPDWMRSLDGKQVRIRGYMDPTFEEENIKQFLLIYSTMEMNFGAPIHPYQVINVTLKNGTTTNYVPINRALDVLGRFKINLEMHQGQIMGLFEMEDAVIPVAAQ